MPAPPAAIRSGSVATNRRTGRFPARERPPLDHQFTGTPFTVGIEEELMIIDAESMDLVSGIEQMLEAVDDDIRGEVKPELMESVLEIASEPCPDVDTVEAQIRGLRRCVREIAEQRGLAIASSGTHPFARWEEQRIVARPRYRDLVSALRFVARQELIFGVHVHIGIDDPDKAVYIADCLRDQIPLLLALSTNSPLWRGAATGMMSTRTPIFRAFPRVGIPPIYGDWEGFASRVEQMMDVGAIEDYTYLWWDVRPHPNLGTVEVRVLDAQTRVEHTVALAALVQGLVHKLAADFDDGERPEHPALELVDENKIRAALHGVEGELIDFDTGTRVPAKQKVLTLLEELAEHAEELGTTEQLGGITDLMEHGTGARRQLVVFEANNDLRELVRELVEVSAV